MLTLAEIERVIAAYDAHVRRNSDDEYDARLAVAEDSDGEVMWEVIATAEAMGYVLADFTSDPGDVDALQDAADNYQAKLRLELESARAADPRKGPRPLGRDEGGRGL